jgi:hypothetical protein
MKERWLLLLLGAWGMGSLVLLFVAPTNFRLIDELLAHSGSQSFHSVVERVGHDATRELLRYLSSELNRKFFLLWNVVQVGLSVALVWLSRALPAARRVAAALLVAAALVGVLLIVQPLITRLGRSLDFVPRQPPPPALAQFQLLHVAYTVIELLKLVALALAALWSLRAAPRAAATASPGAG